MDISSQNQRDWAPASSLFVRDQRLISEIKVQASTRVLSHKRSAGVLSYKRSAGVLSHKRSAACAAHFQPRKIQSMWKKTGAAAFLLLAVCAFTVPSACGAEADEAAFDGHRAFSHLTAQVAFGPRVPESASIRKTREYILAELSRNGFTTGTQRFEADAEVLNRRISGENLYGVSGGRGRARYLLSAHYDSRPIADRDPNPKLLGTPIDGANDGASGVAVLLELARVVHKDPPPQPVALVFFDAEDLGVSSSSGGFCSGSRYMARNLPPELAFEAGVNLDMVGDADLHIPKESNSVENAPVITEKLWIIGAELYPQVFLQKHGPAVYDDHMPFLESGKLYIDLIDFSYPDWHTTADKPDKCSPQSLESVGRTLNRFIRQ